MFSNLLVCCICFFCEGEGRNPRREVALPKMKIVGKAVAGERVFVAVKGRQYVYPKRIQLDINGNVVTGIVCKYPSSVGYAAVKNAINIERRKYLRSDYSRKKGVRVKDMESVRRMTLWRDGATKIVIQKIVIQLSLVESEDAITLIVLPLEKK